MRHDIRLLYLVHTPLCPCPVSVRLPTNSCRQGCYFCCNSSWCGGARYALKHVLTKEDFLRLWEQIIIKNDFRFVWPKEKILNALNKTKILRFVREELFDPSIPEITLSVLRGCFHRGYGLLVKTSSVNVVNYISALKKVKHCVVFSVTDLLYDYIEKVRVINILVGEGLNVTLSLKPIFEYNDRTKYILSSVNQKILGVEVGWLHGKPSWIPVNYLNRTDYKIIRCEKQYQLSHLQSTVSTLKLLASKSNIPLRFYFSSIFSSGKPCCFVDKIF